MHPTYCRHSTDANCTTCGRRISRLSVYRQLADSWVRSDSLPFRFLCSEKNWLKAPAILMVFFKYPFLSQPKWSKIFSPTLAFPFTFHLFALLRFHSETSLFDAFSPIATLKRRKTQIETKYYDAFLVTGFESLRLSFQNDVFLKGSTFETVCTKVSVFICVFGVLVGTIGENASKTHYTF